MGLRILLGGILTLVATGCSAAATQPDASTSPDDAGVDGGADGGAGGGTDAGTVASHAPFPQVVDNGGEILASPSLVTVTFPGYQYESQVQAFGDWAVVSDWFLTAGMEYGVGAGQHLQKVVLPDAAPAEFDEASIATFLTNRIGLGQLPPPEAGILYMLYLPPGTIVTAPVNGQPEQISCRRLAGAHYFLRLGASEFAFAWVATCEQPVPDFPVPFGLDGVTAAASHELIEAATDPFGQGYHLLNYDYSDPWGFLGTEVGDLCVFSFATAGGFKVQRVWSNQAALAGGSPCLPVPKGENFRSVTTSPPYMAPVPAGKSVHFSVEGWSTLPDPWTISMVVWDGTTLPQYTLSSSQISNGTTASLDLKVSPTAAVGSYFVLVLLSQVSPDETAIWPVGIDVQ